MLFGDGYRPNVCIVLCNAQNDVMLFHRVGSGGWQFPQGGVDDHETLVDAMYRELYEEVGLGMEAVKVLAQSSRWYRYNVPPQWLRASSRGHMFGQKQQWFLLQLLAAPEEINFNTTTHPEFNDWCWMPYWAPVHQVVEFKKSVYQRALMDLAPHLPAGGESVHRLFSAKCAAMEGVDAR